MRIKFKKKGKLKKGKEGRENWIKISITYKYRLISVEEYSSYSLTKDYYCNLTNIAGKFNRG